MTTSSAANRSVGSAACPVCEHVNPPDSRFCNACGAPLPLVPCHRCRALNEPRAARCHQCDAWWPGKAVVRSSSPTEAPDAAGSGVRTAETRTQPIARPLSVGAYRHRVNPAARLLRLPVWGLAVIVGTVALAASVAGGYYAYRGRQAVDASRFGAASGAARGGGGPAAIGGLVNPSESARGAAPVAADAQPTAPAPDGSAAAMRPGTTAPVEARSAPTPPVAGSSGEAITSPRRAAAEAKAPADPAGPRPRTAAPRVIEQPPRVGPCTEAVAALGLCTPESAQRRR